LLHSDKGKELLILIFYNLALLAVLILGAPYWLLRMVTSGKYRAGLAFRLGFIPQSLRDAVTGRKVVWLHAVSVGEVIAVSRLINDLRTALPEHIVVVSTTTLASHQLAQQRFGAATVFYFPIDLSFVVRRYLSVLHPALIILAETEFWPSLLAESAGKSIPIVVINARISNRSLPRYKRLRCLWKKLLANITIFLAQSNEDARRLKAIGAPVDRIQVTGNLKFDVCVAEENELTRAVRAALPTNTKVLVAGSTLDAEEAALLKAWPQIISSSPDTIMLLAPRHPERFEAVAQLLETSGITWHQRTKWLTSRPTAPLTPGSVLLLDSIGELAACYALGSIAFVGGSIAKGGGHNPLEPAQFGVPVVMGPSLENFRSIADAMLANEALILVDEKSLALAITRLLSKRSEALAIGARARMVFESQGGATARTLSAILNILRKGNKSQHSITRPWLMPLTPLYAATITLKNKLYDIGHLYTEKLNWPVISIGSLSAGGAGKTPFTLLLATALKNNNWHPDVLSRGYGRNSKKPEKVDAAGTAIQFGDEPLLMAQLGLNVFVASTRYDAGKLAELSLPSSAKRVHLLDDGFQHRRLQRSLDIVLLTARDWYDALLPAGNLREPITILLRADAIVLREDELWLEDALRSHFADVEFNSTIIRVRRTLSIDYVPSRPLVFSGIARPDVFHAMLNANVCLPAHTITFRDHHAYTSAHISALVQTARSVDSNGFITTEKDAVKLTPELRSQLQLVGPITIAKLHTSFCDEDSTMRWLIARLTNGATT